jgi:tyrosyl-tRNA synthetase
MFQHWMATDDRQVRQFLAQFTLLPVTEIDEVVAAHEAAPERREAQRTLAREATALIHGRESAAGAEEAARALFGGPVDALTPGGLEEVLREVATAGATAAELDQGLDVVEALHRTPLARSTSEARRTVAQGGAYVNGERAPEGRRLTRSDLLHGRAILLRSGKRNHAALVVEG